MYHNNKGLSCSLKDLCLSAAVSAFGSVGMQKDEFYNELINMVRRSKGSDVVVAAGDFIEQVGRLSISESCLDEYRALVP